MSQFRSPLIKNRDNNIQQLIKYNNLEREYYNLL